MEYRWVGVREALAYLDLSGAQLAEILADSDIKPIKGGQVSVRVRVRGTWSWDHCPLVETGGQCAFYDEHDGPKISYAMQAGGASGQQIIQELGPTAEAVAEIENVLIGRVASGQSE